MGTITIQINNQSFDIACQDGQEERLSMLGVRLQSRIEAMAGRFNNVDDTHLLLLAALMLIDEAEQIRNQKNAEDAFSDPLEILKLKSRIDTLTQRLKEKNAP